MTVKVILAGPRGRMGTEAIQMILNEDNFELVACIDRENNGKQLKDISGMPSSAAQIYTDAETCFKEVEADVFVDLTIPEVGYQHTKLAIEHNVRPVVGTSGFTSDQVEELNALSKEKQLGGIIAPNFAVGAVLMMKFAEMAAKHMPHVEIIEQHHDQKLDAPSGTAVKTGELITSVRESMKQGHPEEFEAIEGARGAEMDGIRIHSVRLPGLVAHQEVIFGGAGQTLSIKHDSLNRDSFMDGIKLCINEVLTMKELVYGLENIIN